MKEKLLAMTEAMESPRDGGAPRRGGATRGVALLVTLALVAAPASGARRRAADPTDAGGDASSSIEAGLAAPRLQFVDFQSTEGATTIGVTGTGPLLYHTAYETDATTLIVEVPGTDGSELEPVAQVGTAQVDVIKVTQLSPGGMPATRLEVKKSATSKAQVQVDPSNPSRLQIVVTTQSDEPGRVAPSGAGSALAQAAPAPPAAPVARELAAAPAPAARRAAPQPAAPQVASLDDAPVATPERASWTPPAAAAVMPEFARTEPTPVSGPGRLTDATVETADDGRTVIRLAGNRRLSATTFMLQNPLRLCIDLPDVVNAVSSASVPVRDGNVLKVRVAQNQPLPQPVTRIVVELREDLQHEIIEGPNSLVIALGTPVPGRPLSLAQASPMAAPADPQEAGGLLSLPVGLDLAGYGRPGSMRVDATNSTTLRETAGPSSASLGSSGMSSSASATGSRYESVEVTGAKQSYTGEPISISMKDADLQDVFRLFHKFSGLNIVVDQSIKGKTITLELRDVPWDQALALVLQTNGLGQLLEGNVLRIAPLAKLSAEEKQKRELDDAQELSGDLKSIAIPLSYASVSQAESMVRKSLSSRGDIVSDRRTNTLILKDLDKYLEQAQALIALLDTPTRQVQIEARIVETTVDFSKSSGIRWGFGYVADRAFGNQTGFSFPRSVATDYAVNLPGGDSNSVLGLSFRNILNTFTLDVTLDALESRGKARVISRPMVVVQNNEQASINSGFQIPITNTTATETDVTFVPAQLSLQVRPQITADRNVIMDVTVNNDSPGFFVGDNPSISTRQAKTVVAVPDGGTTVIGGIYQVNEGVSSSRVPFLSRIPLLGWLFRNKKIDRTNDELLVFLTPHIVKQY